MRLATLPAGIARRAAAAGVALALSSAALCQTPGPGPAPLPPPAAPAAAPAAPSAAPAADAAATSAPPAATQADLAQVFDDFFKVGLDLDKPLAVRGLTIKRDTMELNLQEGTLYLAKPVAGRITGAYFKGTASIRIALPNAIDRKLLQGAYGKPAFEEDLGEVVLRFDDGAEREILAAATPGSAPAGDPAATWSDRLRIDFNAVDLQVDFLDHLLNGPAAGSFFTAEVHTRDGRAWYGFRHGGRSSIENGIFRERATASAGKRWYETLSMFHRPQDYDAKGNYNLLPGADVKDIAAVRDVTQTVEVPNNKSLLIDARLTVESLRDGVRLLRFDLINNLDAPSWHDPGRPVTTTLVADAGDRELPFLHRWHQLLVLLPRPLTRGERTVVRVKATEDTIIQLTDRSYWIYNTYPWFPNMGFNGGRYTTDWTVKTAAPLRAAGTGTLVREWLEEGMNCVRWKSDVPVQRASLIFGDFKTTDGAHKRESPGTGEVALRLFTIQGGAEHFRGKPENVLYNISQGMKQYETIYGPFPYPQLDIAEMAHLLGFAQSPPGILLVSSILSDTTIDVGRDGSATILQAASQGGLDKLGGGGVGDQFVFHELAHQWWGHQVGVLGDEDAWISESWAEYSAGLVIDAIDPKQFARMREGWKKRALEADPYGTIGTAYRADTPEHPGTFQRLLYDKGPYVVHMLRSWMGWEKFTKYVSTIQSKYRGTSINTNTLAREATALMGYDMFPFFDQWVQDRGIPRVHWSWSAAPDADGKQIVTIKTTQEDKANAKILMVPITFDFGRGDPVVVQKPILTAEASIQVKVPSVPKAVRMDDDETQLATFIADGGRK